MFRGLAVRRAAAVVSSLTILVSAVQLAGSTDAVAHDNAITGVADCGTDGTYSITWTVVNDYQDGETIAVTDHLPAASAVVNGTSHLAAHGSGTVTQTGVPGAATSASLTVAGHWDVDGFTRDDSGSIVLDGNCHLPSPPNHTATPPTVTPARCSGQTPAPGTITIPVDAGVSYALDNVTKPTGTYPVSAGTHTVVASSTTLTLVGQTSFRFDVSSPPSSCATTVTPQAPRIAQGACGATGTPIAPTLTLATTSGITYAAAPTAPYTAGQSVTVTATAAAGNGFVAPAPAGWTYVSSTTETFAVTFASVTCYQTVAPVAPSVVDSTCGSNGSPTVPTITFATTPGVTYSSDRPAPFAPGQVVLVTATADSAHSFVSPAPAGWTYVDGTHDTISVTLTAAPSCARAAAPSFVDATCDGASPTTAGYVIPQTVGVDYFVGGVKVPAGSYPIADGATVTVTAAPQPGYTLGGDTVFTHTFPGTPDCRTVVVATPPRFDPGTCTAGHATSPSYTIPTTAGVQYYMDGARTPAGQYQANANQTVLITARANDGYVLTGVTVFTHTFAGTDACGNVPVTARPAVFEASQCVLGDQVAGSVTIPVSAGVDYYLALTAAAPSSPTPAGTYSVGPGATATVTARAQPGYVLTGSSRFSFTFPTRPECTGGIIAAAVTFHNDQCTAAGVPKQQAGFTIPMTSGATYWVGDRKYPAGTYPVANGATVTVYAKSVQPFVLAGITQWTHVFPRVPTCAGTTGGRDRTPTGGGDSGAIPSSSSPIAYTGVRVSLLLGTGVGILLSGVGLLLLLARPRRRRGFTC